MAGKHKCKFCDARHDSANDAMIHVVKKHADVTSYKHYDDRDHSRRAVEEPCPQCGAKMMPMLDTMQSTLRQLKAKQAFRIALLNQLLDKTDTNE